MLCGACAVGGMSPGSSGRAWRSVRLSACLTGGQQKAGRPGRWLVGWDLVAVVRRWLVLALGCAAVLRLVGLLAGDVGGGSGRRAAFVEFTVRECQDATQLKLVQIRRRFIDTANTLLDAADLPSIRAASRIVREHFPPVEKIADVSDEQRIEDLSDIPDAELDRMREIRDAARRQNELEKTDD